MIKKIYFNITTRRPLWGIATIVLLLILAIFFVRHILFKKTVLHQRPLPSVSITKVKTEKDVTTLSAIGTVKAAEGVQLGAVSPGVVTALNFHSGQRVQAGKVLATLNNGQLKAAVMKDKAALYLAELDEKREDELRKKQYISAQTIDQTISKVKQSKAQLLSDEASLQDTIIKAPFSGQLGIRQVNLGQYLKAGQSIVSLQNINKMYVDFTIPEKQSDRLHVGGRVVLVSHQGQKHQWQAKISALGSSMDSDTRSLPVRAQIIQPYLNLIPGMYADISVLLPEADDKPVVPQSAIVYNPYGNFVYLYQKGVVTQRYVTLGKAEGSVIFVEKGVKAGDQVVTAGQQTLYNGAHVRVAGS